MGFNRSGIEWPGRVKYPAVDPVNSLLSLGYTLVGQELAGLLEGHGLDPYLGLYHQPDYGRQSLALDLLEAFRHPVVDRLVLTILNRRAFTAEDFEMRGGRGGMFLKAASLKRFFEFYERWMLATGPSGERPSFRKLLSREAAEFVKGLRNQMEFRPFSWAQTGDATEEELWNTLSVTI